MTFVRSLLRMIAVPGEAPYDRAALRVFYHARDVESARETGIFPIEQFNGSLPVLVFLPGVNCAPHSYYWLFDRWADHRIVVILEWIGQNLPGRTSYTPGIDIDALAPETYGTKPTASVLPLILSELQAMNESGVLAGWFDFSRIILGGHSAGGTLALQNADTRWFPGVIAAFAVCANPLATMALGGWKDGKLPALPDTNVLLIGGTKDGIGDHHNKLFGRPKERGWETVQAVFDECYGVTDNQKYLVIFKGVNHHSICDPLDETIGRAYMDTPLKNRRKNKRGYISSLVEHFMMVQTERLMGIEADSPEMVLQSYKDEFVARLK